ncbi:glycosyltransferase, partial [Streptomyces sp. NPDC090021]
IVAIPQMGEQRANADRVVELGLGTLLHRHRLTPDQLRSTVDATMHDPGIRARLAVMRERITATGGATAAADVIEHHLTHQDPR